MTELIDTYSWTEHDSDDPRRIRVVVCGDCGALVRKSWNLDHVNPDPWSLHMRWHERLAAIEVHATAHLQEA